MSKYSPLWQFVAASAEQKLPEDSTDTEEHELPDDSADTSEPELAVEVPEGMEHVMAELDELIGHRLPCPHRIHPGLRQ